MSVAVETSIRPSRLIRMLFLSAIGCAAVGLVVAYVALLQLLPGVAIPVLAAVGVFAAALLSSVVGFAFSPLCAPLLLYLGMGPVELVQVLLVSSIAIQSYSLSVLRCELETSVLAPLLLGGMIGLPVGLWLLLSLPRGMHALPIGSFILAYGLFTLVRPGFRMRQEPGRWADVLVGGAGGLTGGLAAFPSGLVVIWCGAKGWSKERQRSAVQPFILLMQIATLALLAALAPAGGSQMNVDAAQLAYIPPALFGAVCGLRAFRGLTDRQFARGVSALLVVAGFSMLV